MNARPSSSKPYMLAACTVLLVAAGGFVLLGGGTSPDAEPPPVQVTQVAGPLTADPAVYDAGVIADPAVRQIAHTFTLTNTSSAMVTIEGVRSTCSCAVADAAGVVLEPGGSTELPVTLSLNAAGLNSATIMVKPEVGGVLALRISADFRPGPQLHVAPAHLLLPLDAADARPVRFRGVLRHDEPLPESLEDAEALTFAVLSFGGETLVTGPVRDLILNRGRAAAGHYWSPFEMHTTADRLETNLDMDLRILLPDGSTLASTRIRAAR